MKERKWIFFAVALLLIGGAAGVLNQIKTYQKLGQPGVKFDAQIENRSQRVLLPERLLDYKSELVDQERMVLDTLPQDTSFGQRRYQAPDGFAVNLAVVLMRTDRTSIHKPQFCIEGAGWHIDQSDSREEKVRIERPIAYELPVMKLLVSRLVERNGQTQALRGIYAYWFVADDAYTARHGERMWWMARELLTTGVLQRWAYVSAFAVCLPGQEEATFTRMKKIIAAAVPEFQLTPKAKESVVATQP